VRKFQTRGERREQHGRGGRTRQHEVAEDIAVTPRMYQRLTAKIAGKPEERILAYLMLRSLRQARYSERNEGHFALAASAYTHFTSPIRRYPDLIVHRIAKALLRAGVSGRGELVAGEPHAKKQDKGGRGEGKEKAFEVIPEAELALIATESSENERRAADAERELVEWKKLKFMQDRVGEEFDAMILSATKYGLFVELQDLFVEGLVPLQSLGALDNDYYTYRENTRQIIGERWGRKFVIGQRVRVVLDRVDAAQKRLQFSILDEDGDAGPFGSPTARPKTGKAKKKKDRGGAVPAFATHVAQPAGKKKGRRKKGKPSMQRQSGKPHPFPKKMKKRRR